MRALYISHNGMLEGLGQSQVLPYLRGLARRGARIDLLSYELPGAAPEAVESLHAALEGSGVSWTPLSRARDTRFSVKIRESAKGVARALALALSHRPDIVHGRSYLPTAICDVIASVVPKARLVFDCRGMIGDEYVDAGHWTPDRFEYRAVKRYESRAFRRANGVVVLTDALQTWIHQQGWLGPRTRITTIPCCVDLEKFRFDAAARQRLRAELGLGEAFVIVYAGSLGTWYRERELARFAAIMSKRGADVRFLVLTPAPPEELVRMLAEEGMGADRVVVRHAKPAEMPAYLSAGDLGLSFIMSCFSKTGSSPTKVAEYLACGLPVVLNGDIGDQADLAAEVDACVVLTSFDAACLEQAADHALRLGRLPIDKRVANGRRVADQRFGLERVGVARYERLYRALLA